MVTKIATLWERHRLAMAILLALVIATVSTIVGIMTGPQVEPSDEESATTILSAAFPAFRADDAEVSDDDEGLALSIQTPQSSPEPEPESESSSDQAPAAVSSSEPETLASQSEGVVPQQVETPKPALPAWAQQMVDIGNPAWAGVTSDGIPRVKSNCVASFQAEIDYCVDGRGLHFNPRLTEVIGAPQYGQHQWRHWVEPIGRWIFDLQVGDKIELDGVRYTVTGDAVVFDSTIQVSQLPSMDAGIMTCFPDGSPRMRLVALKKI